MNDSSFDLPPEEIQTFERRLDQALATAPSLVIPSDFATRIAALVPAHKPLPAPAFNYARRSVFLSGAVLLLALLWIAPHVSTGATYAIALEWTLSAELSLVALAFVLPGSSWTLNR